MLCYITCVMLGYITYVLLYNMFSDITYAVMLYNMCYVMYICYVIQHVMLCYITNVMLYNLCYMTHVMLCYVI